MPASGPTAAYLYVLSLDASARAWEYLRRNSGYLQEWRRYGKARRPAAVARASRRAEPWGCDFLEDPREDARTAEPVWLPDPDPLVTLGPAITDGAEPFSLWALPGRKNLVHDGRRLLMRSTVGWRALRIAVSLSLGDGMPFVYAVPAGVRGQRGLKAAADLDAALTGSEPKLRRAAVTRTDLVHMRALQALDAEAEGASERAIADLVFGPFDEPESWNDSAVRANVRYLLDQGRRLRDGGYRDLLYPKPPKREAAST